MVDTRCGGATTFALDIHRPITSLLSQLSFPTLRHIAQNRYPLLTLLSTRLAKLRKIRRCCNVFASKLGPLKGKGNRYRRRDDRSKRASFSWRKTRCGEFHSESLNKGPSRGRAPSILNLASNTIGSRSS